MAPNALSLLPDMPTTLEAGFRQCEYPLWLGVFLPAKTPLPDIVGASPRDAQSAAEPKGEEQAGNTGHRSDGRMTPTEFVRMSEEVPSTQRLSMRLA
ncbi:MAG: hypothetical protein IPP85_16505 [Propionivibrio sp.]|nr:hypothetical protein [Propionivibrio sp.]